MYCRKTYSNVLKYTGSNSFSPELLVLLSSVELYLLCTTPAAFNATNILIEMSMTFYYAAIVYLVNIGVSASRAER